MYGSGHGGLVSITGSIRSETLVSSRYFSLTFHSARRICIDPRTARCILALVRLLDDGDFCMVEESSGGVVARSFRVLSLAAMAVCAVLVSMKPESASQQRLGSRTGKCRWYR